MASTPTDAAFIAALGLAYIVVGWRVARRRSRSGPHQGALLAFASWWWGVAGLFTLCGLAIALRASGVDDGALHLALTAVSMLSLCIGLFGILYYVTFLVWGRGFVAVYAAYYAAIFAALVYGASSDATQPEAWASSVSRLVILTGPVLTGAIFAFLVPVIVASALYASLYPKLDRADQKLRVASTSIAFVAWFGSAILASVGRFADAAWWTSAGRLIGIAATGLIVVGYWPPPALTALRGTTQE